MEDQLNAIRMEIASLVKKAREVAALEAIERRYLGRKGELTAILKTITSLSAEERPKLGALANQIKTECEQEIAKKRRALTEETHAQAGEREREDVTEPGMRPPEGHLHLVTQAIHEMTEIFEKIGFMRARYPEVEWDWYAFESLNMPPDHPARDEWETFFVDIPPSRFGKMVLTPHTSNAQVRELERGTFPVRMINIAKCYRRQSDATHVPMFHQCEGLFVDRGVALTHLIGTLIYFAHVFFGPTRAIRLRPFHFRFTEPSFEIDVSCGVCGGTGRVLRQRRDGGRAETQERCRVCKRGWLELGGAGMVHPNVLKAANVNPKTFSGFAFGWGVERTYMMKEGMQIDDIRILYKNDLRFLTQF